MRSFRYLAAIAACLSSFGCNVSTVQPLHSPDAAIYDPGLVGTWSMENGAVSLSISREENGYAIVVKSRDQSASYSAKLLELGGQRFCDCRSTKPTGPDAVPVHHVFRVTIDQDELRVGIAEPSNVKTALAKDPARAEYVTNEGRFVLTGSTAEVQTFFRECGRDIFMKELKFRRR
jgi:hypothetical protein